MAVLESLTELKPFMPWATDGYQIQDMADFIDRSVTGWTEGTEFNYAVFTAVGDLIGAIGLMDRMGPGILEIGYWMRTAYAGRGHMTAAVGALTRVALTLPGIDRLAIQYDAANASSAAVAAKAGFTETGRLVKEPEAPGESGTHIVTERRA
jgi:ribosomal-protein-serine acetyltransferase